MYLRTAPISYHSDSIEMQMFRSCNDILMRTLSHARDGRIDHISLFVGYRYLAIRIQHIDSMTLYPVLRLRYASRAKHITEPS